MDFLQKHFNGVFELPLPRNAQSLTKKKTRETKSRVVGGCGWVYDLANARGPLIFFAVLAGSVWDWPAQQAIFLPPPRKHRQMGCFGSGLACIRVGALQNYFLPPPPFPVGALSTVPVGLATRICFSGLEYNGRYLRSRPPCEEAVLSCWPDIWRKTQQTMLL
jgi:hypothetical protein